MSEIGPHGVVNRLGDTLYLAGLGERYPHQHSGGAHLTAVIVS